MRKRRDTGGERHRGEVLAADVLARSRDAPSGFLAGLGSEMEDVYLDHLLDAYEALEARLRPVSKAINKLIQRSAAPSNSPSGDAGRR